jgi:hypothetical protein
MSGKSASGNDALESNRAALLRRPTADRAIDTTLAVGPSASQKPAGWVGARFEAQFSSDRHI